MRFALASAFFLLLLFFFFFLSAERDYTDKNGVAHKSMAVRLTTKDSFRILRYPFSGERGQGGNSSEKVFDNSGAKDNGQVYD